MKQEVLNEINRQKEKLIQLSDYIHDHPQWDGHETLAAKVLTEYLKEQGFEVEIGIAGLPTAFRAVYEKGNGGPSIGFLCEYDALEGLGHGCGHHMQGPSCLGAAVALKRILENDKKGDKESDSKDDFVQNVRLVVYGTPAEETFGGKINMLNAGYFKDIDVALMMHGAPDTCTDIKCLALSSFDVTYLGKSAHAALAPEKGRSAFDSLLLAFQGVEFLREHVRDDVRMHYTMLELPGPENVVPDRAVGRFTLRSYSRDYLNEVIERFHDIIKGAALMSGTEFEIKELPALDNKIPVFSLNDLLMENAKQVGAPQIVPPREKTGSTDFGNVMHQLPGACIRVQFVPVGTSSHTKAYVEAGKTDAAHNCVMYGAKILAGTAWDLITSPALLKKVKEEFIENRKIYG